MINNLLIVPIAISFFITLFLIPNWMKRAERAKLTGKDIHKLNSEDVAEAGGVTIISGFALGLLAYVAINTFVFKSYLNFIKIFSLLSCILLIGFIAFTDDILGWKIGLGKRNRILLVAFASIPLIVINAGKSTIALPFLGILDLGLIYPIVLIPIGIVGATTTYNFLAGYNGLEAGLGILLLSALAIVSYFTGSSWLSVIALCMIASLLAFLIFNFSPAKIFPGDSLTYPVGGLIAVMAILGNFEKIAVFFFIPVILEFFLKARGKFVKESFGVLREDGGLNLRYEKIYSLNHLAIYLMNKKGIKPTEIRVVLSVWAFQLLIILIGFLLFRGGIFYGL